MNDMVSIRKIRPGAEVLSSTHAGVAVETLLGTSLSAADAARVLAIDALERGDNRSSLAAGRELELQAEVRFHELLALGARVVAENQVIPGGLIDGWRKTGIDICRGGILGDKNRVSRTPVRKLGVLVIT
jgi:hypothetical protein